ncbi:MAG: hypothetical protein ABSC64_19700 [Candidatus Korobacteraceae bacterium]|jgi:hypothetical protein
MEIIPYLIFLVAIPVAVIIIYGYSRREETPYEKEIRLGRLNPELFCPHCQSKGFVRDKWVTQKAGISGGKATAAVLTGGLSLLAVGLSRKQQLTQAHCEKCGSTWVF